MFILIFILGFALLHLLSRDFKLTEKLALAMPMGFGLTAGVMFLLDRTIHSITATNIMVTDALLIIVLMGARMFLDYKANDLPWKRPRTRPDFRWLTLVWVVFAGMSAYLVYGISVKSLYWPTHDFDAILGYDLLSKAISHEHTLTNSVLTSDPIVNNCGPRMLYPPLFALCNSLAYFDGMEIPGLVTTLFFISWAFTCYALLRRLVSSTGAIIATFLSIMIPEMFYRASVCGTNLPCAIYTSIAVMSFVIWYEQRRDGFFFLSFIAMIFGVFTRSEAILFVTGIMIVLLYVAIRERRFKYVLIYPLTVLPLLIWGRFLAAYVPREQSGIFILQPFYDPAKLKQVLDLAWDIMSNKQYYGVTAWVGFIGFILVFALNVGVNFSKKKNKILLGVFIAWMLLWFVIGANLITLVLFAAIMFAGSYLNDDKWEFLLIFLMALGIYTLMFYQMKNDDGSLFSGGGWIQSGYKRGLFCYAPLVFCILFTSKWVSYAIGVVDDKMTLFKKPAGEK